jgi:hypothetical protein
MSAIFCLSAFISAACAATSHQTDGRNTSFRPHRTLEWKSQPIISLILSPPALYEVLNPWLGQQQDPSPMSFSFTSNLGASGAGTLVVTQGTAGLVNLTIQSTDGFVEVVDGNPQTFLPLAYNCSGLPAETNCLFFPNYQSNSSVTPTVKVTTSAATRASVGHKDRIFYAALLPGFFGIVFVGGSRKRTLRRMQMAAITVLGSAMLCLNSCGGSNNSSLSNAGTPLGTYTVTVNATTAGSNPISSSYQFKLAVTNP